MRWKNFVTPIWNWERWPFWLRYAGIAPVWLWYCVKSRSLWFFSASNPTITFGGFDGEGKREMYEQLPPELYPKTIYINRGTDEDALLKKISEAGFAFPFCVKPDVGLKGLLFRKIDNKDQLLQYHRQAGIAYIVQDLILYPLEVSIFYYRHPAQQQGVISGFIQKDLMEVFGDGQSSLFTLIKDHPNARHRLPEMKLKHAQALEKVLPKGERYVLAYAANLNRGARFSSLLQHADEGLLRLFDALSHQTNFFYGRYDIKCRSVEDLKKGTHFQILEFNGAGAEPNHIYHAGLTLLQAYAEILKHWKALYLISKYNHEHGHPYWSFGRGRRFLKAAGRHVQHLEKMDNRILV